MGYELHIMRRNRQGKITSQEWLAYVDGDPELCLSPEGGPYFVVWRKGTDDESWFDWWGGAISTKQPADVAIEKMIAIAHALNAHVEGDDGEVYRSAQEPPVFP